MQGIDRQGLSDGRKQRCQHDDHGVRIDEHTGDKEHHVYGQEYLGHGAPFHECCDQLGNILQSHEVGEGGTGRQQDQQ